MSAVGSSAGGWLSQALRLCLRQSVTSETRSFIQKKLPWLGNGPSPSLALRAAPGLCQSYLPLNCCYRRLSSVIFYREPKISE